MITTDFQLRQLAKLIEQVDQISFDLEADSLRSYPERICLIQICIEDRGEFLVDTLAPINIRPLLEAFSKVELIVHGSDYDLRLLRRAYDYSPRDIFDTQEAARLVGCRRFGLGALTEQYLNIELDKKHQRADWTKRPLSEELRTYARMDARVLFPLSRLLRTELQSTGRSEWHRQNCQRLIDDARREKRDDRSSAWRIKGCSKLTRVGLGALRELWRWREEEALKANRPPFFILDHDRLIQIAERAAQNQEFDDILPRRFPIRRRRSLDSACARAKRLEADELPEKRAPAVYVPRPQTERERDALEDWKSKRDEVATDLDIDPTVIANKATLEAMAVDESEASLSLLPWQADLLGARQREHRRNGSSHSQDLNREISAEI